MPELEPKDLKCDALNQTHIEVNFTQIEYIRWNGVPIGYKVFWGSMLQLEDKEIFQVVNFNSTSLNVHNVEEPSFQYTITIMDLEIFTNYSIIVGAYNGEGIGKLARVYCRTQEGGNFFLFMIYIGRGFKSHSGPMQFFLLRVTLGLTRGCRREMSVFHLIYSLKYH